MTIQPGNEDRMYRRLGVSPEASAGEIRAAYRRLAHEVHPDAHPEDPEAARRFQEITEAYEILASPTRPARYDQAGRNPDATSPARLIHRGGGQPGAPRSTGQAFTSPPVALGTSPVHFGSQPLLAGPVHVGTPAAGTQVSLSPEDEVDSLVEAIRYWWGWP